MTYYRRKPADASVLAGAFAAGAAIGAVTFYLAKLWLQREPLIPEDESESGDELEPDGGSDMEGGVEAAGEAEFGEAESGDGEIEPAGDPEPETSEGAESSR